MRRLSHAVAGGLAVTTFGVASLAASATSAAAVSAVACSDLTSPVRQLVKPSAQTSILTQWPSEAKSAAERWGFTDDRGIVAKVSNHEEDGLVPVWRLYKSGDFVWATEGSRADSFKNQGYTAQFVDFYAAAADSSCLAPMYQMRKGSIHRMVDEVDLTATEDDGWTREQVAFWVVPSEGTSDPSPADPTPTTIPPTADPNPTDTKFTIAVLPDTQNESNSAFDKRFSGRAAWLLENKQSLDLRYAVQVGDLVNWGNVVPQQFDNMSSWWRPLEAEISWAGTIGNHDTAAVCIGGSACPGAQASSTVRDTSAYNKAFPVSRFPNVRGTFEQGKVDNSYQEFAAGGKVWMILSLELWPRKEVVDWARQVVASHPDDNVIVDTHAYLDPDGSISASNGGYGATSPQYLYDNLVKQYPNVKMTLSGHVGDGASRTDTGVKGNKIVSLLQCYHSTSNPVRLVEIDTAAGTITSKVYAPQSDAYYSDDATSTSGMSFAG